jgi:hypothetical protein
LLFLKQINAKELQRMEYQPQVGRPLTLTDEVKERVLQAVSLAFRPQTIAHYAKVHPNNLKRWLKLGCEDAEQGLSTEYAQFWSEFHHKQAAKVVQWLKDVEDRRQNWQATWELVKSVAREDYGVEAVEYKELLEMFNGLSEAFKRFSENPLSQSQGASNHGREMDSESHSQE